jgi:signal transduction histidine kinase
MRKLLEEALNSFSHDIANKGLRLELSLAELSVETDRVLMQAIVSNLIQNAVRYSDDNAALHIYLGSTGDVWSLSVSNNGTPISQDMLHKFNESAIIHNESGHGLGLIIVKSYSQILGLSCQISSTEGSTTFTISNK